MSTRTVQIEGMFGKALLWVDRMEKIRGKSLG